MPDVTISLTTAQWNRISAAFGKYLNTQDVTDPENPVPRDATGAEVKASVINFVKQVVFDKERQAAREAADATISDLDPS